MSAERLLARYRIETPLELARAAEVLAGEQSSGTFVAVPGETQELKDRFGARVESITPLDDVAQPSLPGSRIKGGRAEKYHRGEITISWPTDNFGHNLPTLAATVAGNLFELSQLSGVKLLDLDIPDSFARHYAGPRFGIDDTRRLTAVFDRPLIGTIIKPSIGLTPQQTANLVKQLVEAGIDFIKDDELMANAPHSPLAERVSAVMPVILEHADRTGKKVMYAFNISDEIDATLRHADLVRSAGGSAVMVSVNWVGLAGVKRLSDEAGLPIHGHRNGFGAINRSPVLGIGFPAYQKLWRLAGVDQLHVNGLANKFWEPDDSVVRSIESCLAPAPGRAILPVVSSGQTVMQAPMTYQRTKTVDLLFLAGGGIMAHPLGPAAGVRALQQAWEAAVSGIPLESHAAEHPELARAMEKFTRP